MDRPVGPLEVPRRIGINVSWMSPGQAGGMEWYVRNLIRELAAIDDRHEWVVVTSPANWHLFDVPPQRWTKIAYGGDENSPASYTVLLPSRPSTLRERLRHTLARLRAPRLQRAIARLRAPRMRRWRGHLHELIRQQELDLWFCPLMYALPVETVVPVVNTIPDLQHEHFPEFFSTRELALRTMGYRYSCTKAAATIGISDFVSRDLIKRYGLDGTRTVGVPLALDPSYTVGPDVVSRLADDVRLKYRLEDPFIYYPANGWRHKNHETLVRAFKIIREKRRDLRLVLTGCEFDVMDRLRPIFESLDEAHAVRHLGYVERRDTIGLYAAASVMVFPSLFEGFGLPLLEAMHFGTPVVCSAVASIPEIAGDAAIYVEPGDPAALGEAVLRLLEDEMLRERLVEAGRERVRQFSFTETARRTLDVFEQVLAGAWRAPDLAPFRPLIPHHWLLDGHSRWYFHFGELREIRLRIVQPTRLAELAEQRVTVWLNEQPVLEASIEPEREYVFTITPPAVDTDFHRLDIRAAANVAHRGQRLSLQVRALTLVDGRGLELSLLE
jgi:glycosyltransferase involved in cell wall biosynthesis